MSSLAFQAVLVPLAVVGAAVAAVMAYVYVRYSPIIVRIFEETPVFAPMRVAPSPGGEDVRFTTSDGLGLAGTYYRTPAAVRAGVIAFCPEFLGDRWSALAYAEGLREAGFDLFTFDFRNHGESDSDPTYDPLQWVSDLEVIDLRAALDYLRSRADRDPAGVGLFGISRGGGAALAIAADDPTVWGVATDGAFPTHGTMLTYVKRWACIPIRRQWVINLIPHWLFVFVAYAARAKSASRQGRKYPSLERAVDRLAPRPWLMIHGEKDVYIGPEIALGLFERARSPKDAWVVPGAKHNRCREIDPDAYRARLCDFFRRFAPRRSPGVDSNGAKPSVKPNEARVSVSVPSRVEEGLAVS